MRRFFLSLALIPAFLGLIALSGCSNDPDKTGDGEGGFGPPGVNGTNLPQTEEEIAKRQQEEEAAFRKTYKGGK